MTSTISLKHRLAGVSAACIAALTLSMNAAPFQFNNGDLILGVRAGSGNGSTKNVFLNLGSGISHRDNGNLGQLANIGDTLASVFGPDWYDRNNLFFGVVGNLSASPATGFGSVAPVNGDPSRTFYIAVPTSSPGAAPLVPEGTYVPSALGSAGTKFSGMEQMLLGTSEIAGLDQQPDGTATLDQGQQPVQWNNGWTAWNPIAGAAFDIFAGGIQQSFGKATDTTLVDIQRLLATNTGANPTGVVGGGTYETTISISRTGVVTAFTPPPDQPELDVALSDGTQLAAGTSVVPLGSVALTQTGSPITFLIQSAGTGALVMSSISLTGDHPGDFVVTGPSSLEVASGDTASFTVEFTPSALGARSAVLRIASNDADEDPFDIQLSGTGVALAPEIQVEQPADTPLVSGTGSLNFGTNVEVGTPGASFSFKILNTGNDNLTGIALTKFGAHPDDFTVVGPDMNALAPTEFTTFTVVFQPLDVGIRSADLFIASNDGDENPFHIRITGSAFRPAPEIEITGPGGGLLVNGKDDFRFPQMNARRTSKPHEFTVTNTGTADLTGLKLSVFGRNRRDFIARDLNVVSLAPGASTTFNVFLRPNAAGLRSAIVALESNDADEDPFTMSFSGIAVRPAPQISVQQPVGSDLAAGRSKTSFGTVVVGNTVTRTYTIENTGSARLNRLQVSTSGRHSGDFTVTQPEFSSLAAGASTTFSVVFEPSVTGTRNAKLHVRNNVVGKNPFDINITGLGVSR